MPKTKRRRAAKKTAVVEETAFYSAEEEDDEYPHAEDDEETDSDDDGDQGSIQKKKPRVANKISWEVWIQSLIQYKAEHGDCRVPTSHKDRAGRGLGWWVKDRRRNAKKKLSQAQRDQLTEIGFVWESRQELQEAHWQDMFTRLQQFKAANLHTRVPKNYDHDPQLGAFVQRQREANKRGRLLAERHALLESIDFVWVLQKQKKKKKQPPPPRRPSLVSINYS